MSEIDRGNGALDGRQGTAGLSGAADVAAMPQLQADRPWPSGLAEALDRQVDAWTYALNLTDRHALGEAGLEEFLMAEQMDQLRSPSNGSI